MCGKAINLPRLRRPSRPIPARSLSFGRHQLGLAVPSAAAKMFERRYAPYVAAATILMTLQPILVALTKVDGKYLYVQISTTLIAEALKFLLSGLFYVALPSSAKTHHLLSTRHLMPFAAPGAIYFINNNLIFVILAYVNSTTYQILSSLKTVFTAILFRLILKHKLSDLQMLAIVLLTCGTATSQIGTTAVPCEGQAAAPSSRIGVAAAVLTCVLSALGGVYSERLMKHDAKVRSISHAASAGCWLLLLLHCCMLLPLLLLLLLLGVLVRCHSPRSHTAGRPPNAWPSAIAGPLHSPAEHAPLPLGRCLQPPRSGRRRRRSHPARRPVARLYVDRLAAGAEQCAQRAGDLGHPQVHGQHRAGICACRSDDADHDVRVQRHRLRLSPPRIAYTHCHHRPPPHSPLLMCPSDSPPPPRLEVGLFGATPTPQLLISATVVACAVYLYNRAAPPRVVLQTRTPGCTPSDSDVGYQAGGRGGGREREREKERLLGGDRSSGDGAGGMDEFDGDRDADGPVTMLVRGEGGYSIRRCK